MPIKKCSVLKVLRSPSGNELVSLGLAVQFFPEVISATEPFSLLHALELAFLALHF